MPRNLRQSGIIHLWLILIIIAIILSGVFLVNNFRSAKSVSNNKPVVSPSPVSAAIQTSSPSASTSAPQQAKKGDLAALEKYCMEEALKLPEVPFTYKSKEGPTRSGPMPWVDQFIPKDKKQSERIGCTTAYRFDGRTAYGEMGAKYPGEAQVFDRAVRSILAGKIDSSWEKASGPSISSDGFNMVYKRENPQMGTIDFIDAFDGGLVIYVKFNTYYK